MIVLSNAWRLGRFFFEESCSSINAKIYYEIIELENSDRLLQMKKERPRIVTLLSSRTFRILE